MRSGNRLCPKICRYNFMHWSPILTDDDHDVATGLKSPLSCLLNGALTRGAVTKTLRVIEPGTWWQSLLAKPPVYYHSFRFRFWVHPGSVRLRHTPKIRNRNNSYKLVFCSQTMVDSLIENFSLAFNFDFRWVWGPSLTYASKFLLCQNIVTLDLSFRLDFKLGLSSSLTEG